VSFLYEFDNTAVLTRRQVLLRVLWLSGWIWLSGVALKEEQGIGDLDRETCIS